VKIRIITDSTSNLEDELVKKYDIDVIPAYAIIDEQEYIDDGSTPPEKFFELIANSKSAKTSMPSPQNVMTVLERNTEYDHLIMVHVSDKLSGTINVVQSVIKQFNRRVKNTPKITVFDSKGSSYFLGVIALKASQLVRQDLGVEEIIKQLKDFRDNDVQVMLSVTDLTNLYQGGRISKLQYYLADAIHAYPIITLIDGALEPIGKDIGSRRTHRKLIEKFKECYKKDDEVMLWYAETVPSKYHDRFLQMLKRIRRPKVKQLIPFKVGNAIVCHTGITVVGIVSARNFDFD
jgi:DegV family protein with EDD domain